MHSNVPQSRIFPDVRRPRLDEMPDTGRLRQGVMSTNPWTHVSQGHRSSPKGLFGV